MKHLLFALAVLAVFIIAMDIAFLHGLTRFVVTSIVNLF